MKPTLDSFPSRVALAALALASLVACTSLGPTPAVSWLDLGPVLTPAPAVATSTAGTANTRGPSLAAAVTLPAIDAPLALEGTAVGYRLLYAPGQSNAPRAYAQARWTMPPASLLRERIKARLGQDRPVLQLGDQAGTPVLRLELEEFSQVFDSPQASRGVLRLRATLIRSGSLLAQRVLVAERPAPTADSAGGAVALALASDAVADELAAWVASSLPAR